MLYSDLAALLEWRHHLTRTLRLGAYARRKHLAVQIQVLCQSGTIISRRPGVWVPMRGERPLRHSDLEGLPEWHHQLTPTLCLGAYERRMPLAVQI